MAKRRDKAGPSGPVNLDEGRRLIMLYATDTSDPGAIADAMTTICARIAEQFDPLIGTRAPQALLARSVHLCKPWFKALEAVPTAEARSDAVSDLAACLRGTAPKEALGVAIGVLGTFVALLTRFIGEELGLRLLREAFPDRAARNLDGKSS